METVTKEFNVYKYTELSEKAKNFAYDRWYQNAEFGWNQEYRDTLDEFCERFRIRITRWSVGPDRYDIGPIDWRMENFPSECRRENLRAIVRVSKFIIGQIQGASNDCIFTGFFADCAALDVYNSVKNWTMFFTSYDGFVRESLETFFDAWSKDMEYAYSRECFEETASDSEYLKSGEVFTCSR